MTAALNTGRPLTGSERQLLENTHRCTVCGRYPPRSTIQPADEPTDRCRA